MWASVTKLRPGVTFSASGNKIADPISGNRTMFTINNDTPELADATRDQEDPGLFTIKDSSVIPVGQFSVGVSMGEKGVFAAEAGPNLEHRFLFQPTYFITASEEVQEGNVLVCILQLRAHA
jgi:hypothetical protein